MDGWICLDKPSGMSSNLAMIIVRNIFGCKAGYIGTLDPFATGVLPIAIGESRKIIPYISNHMKTYFFKIRFGIETDSLDIDGEEIANTNLIPSQEEIEKIIPNFFGKQMQNPPKYSAIKISGKRSCDRVRNGEAVSISPRNIEVISLKLLDFSKDGCASFMIKCSQGTYVRSIARDMAYKLNSLGHVIELRRMQSGFFSIKNSITIEKLREIVDTESLASVLIPIESPLDDIPALYLDEYELNQLKCGSFISVVSDIHDSRVCVFDKINRELMGIAAFSDDGLLKPVRNLYRTF